MVKEIDKKELLKSIKKNKIEVISTFEMTSIEKIVKEFKKKGFKKVEILEAINKLKKLGEIYEGHRGFISLMR